MTSFWTSVDFPAAVALASAVLLPAGLAAAALLARTAARAHATLVVAALLALALPALTRIGRSAGLGVLPATSAASVPTDRPRMTPGAGNEADAQLAAGSAAANAVKPSRAREPSQLSSLVGSAPAAAVPARSSLLARLAAPTTLLTLWLVLSAVVLLRLLVGVFRGLRIIARAVPVEDPVVRQRLDRAARRIGVDSIPLLFQSAAIRSPVIWCWSLRPTLLVPQNERLTAARGIDARIDWESIFCHELAHWKRRDHLTMLLSEFLCCAVPWNPLAWILRSRLAFLADRACDEHVVAAGCDAPDFADSLLNLVPAAEPALAPGAVSTRKRLQQRIEAILAQRSFRPTAGRTWLACVTGIAACFGLTALVLHPAPAGAQPKQQPTSAVDPEAIADRLNALTEDNWREAFAVGQQLASLPGDEGFEMLVAHWPTLPRDGRQQMLKAWRFSAPFPLRDRLHPRLLDVLNLGMTDAAPDVQNWSINYLRDVTFRDFANDYPQYLTWYEQNRSRTLMDVMRDECRRHVSALATASGPQLEALAKLDCGILRDVPQLAEIVRQAGLLDTFARWMSDPAQGTEPVLRAMAGVLPYAGADENYLRTVVLNAAQNGPSEAIRSTAIRTLAKPENKWAVEALLGMLLNAYRAGGEGLRTSVWGLAQALGELQDPSVIPTLIAIIADDNSYDTVYGIGYFGLGKLTGVRYDESHNGAWWKDWWSKNAIRYPQFTGATPLPTIERPSAARSAAPQNGGDDEDVKDVPLEDIRIGKDENQRYFLIGFDKKKVAPKDGHKLLVVLPGGDGSADFNPFVKRIWKNALPEGYVIAQAVAPKWRDDENRIVWPTKQSPDEKMKFSTEEFIQQIIKDVKRRVSIDKPGVFALGWSSGGPPVYNVALLKESPLHGAFVAMSVYKPEQLPERENAKGRAFYLLHSPQDFIKMTFPEAAEKELTAAGARVKLQTYEGGHGWRGDVFGNIRRGVEWLAAPQTAEKK